MSVASGKGDGARAALQLANVQVENSAVEWHIRRSEADQWEKEAVVMLAQCQVDLIGLVRTMEGYMGRGGGGRNQDTFSDIRMVSPDEVPVLEIG